MGFASQQFRKQTEKKPWKINPVWRGIGCFLILIIPVMSWLAATMFLQSDQKIIRSPNLNRPITIKYSQIQEIDRVIADINHLAVTNNFTEGQIFLTILFLVVGYGILAFMYAALYSFLGPPRYGPFDVPPDMMKR